MSKISIIIPNYNNANWLIKTLDSCINQGVEFIKEIIIIDDFSTDNSREILGEYQKKHPGLVKPFINKFSGSNNARNYGFELSSGEYIQWLDSDDQLLPGKFKKQLSKFDETPDADIVYSDWQMDFYEAGKFQKTELRPLKPHDDFLCQLLLNNWLPPNNYLHKRSIVEKTIRSNGWNPETFLAQDREYITISAILGAKFAYTPGFFAIYNRWSKSTISQVDHKRSIDSALKLESVFLKQINAREDIDNSKKRSYFKILNTVYLASLFYYPGVKYYKWVSAFNLSPSSIHYKLRPFIPFLLLFSWIKYFFGELFDPITFIKKAERKLKHGLRYYLFPGHMNVLLRDKQRGIEGIEKNDKIHLDTSMNWLKTAQDNSSSKGVSMCYSFYDRWRLAYPETTGYIIDTFIEYYRFTGDQKSLERAVQMGLWETDIQLKDGSVRIGTPDNKQVDVFDTGMVLIGYTSLYTETKNDLFLRAAIKCGDWLCNVIDENGAWSKFTFKQIPHGYHTMISWALYKLYLIANNPKYKEAVDRNINWAFSLRRPSGWIDCMAFSSTEDPYTHNIGYTIQGFMELYNLKADEDPLKKMLLKTVIDFCGQLMEKFELDKEIGFHNMFLLPGTVNENWKSTSAYVCLTGNAQLAIVYYDLYSITSDQRYYKTANNLITVVKQTQKLKGGEYIRGGIAGSYPFWGGYHAHEYPNWAAKFFADALMRKIKIDQKINADQIH